jgi:hypothetical protein
MFRVVFIPPQKIWRSSYYNPFQQSIPCTFSVRMRSRRVEALYPAPAAEGVLCRARLERVRRQIVGNDKVTVLLHYAN